MVAVTVSTALSSRVGGTVCLRCDLLRLTLAFLIPLVRRLVPRSAEGRGALSKGLGARWHASAAGWAIRRSGCALTLTVARRGSQ